MKEAQGTKLALAVVLEDTPATWAAELVSAPSIPNHSKLVAAKVATVLAHYDTSRA